MASRPPRFAERRRQAGGAPAGGVKRIGGALAAPEHPASVPPETLVLLGVVLGALGVRGELRVKAFTEAPEGLAAYGPLYGDDGRRLLTPLRARAHRDGAALTTVELRDRDAAEALKGVRLHAPRALLPPAAEDEFYHVDLVGLDVVSTTGERLGKVAAVQNFGAGDILQIEKDGVASWLEFTKATVPLVDLAGRRLVAAPPSADEPEAG